MDTAAGGSPSPAQMAQCLMSVYSIYAEPTMQTFITALAVNNFRSEIISILIPNLVLTN